MDILQKNFSGITLDFHDISKHFVDFQFYFQYFQKMTAKFQFHSNRFENFKISHFSMAKVKKVNIAVNY
jgi:hypothetical protein